MGIAVLPALALFATLRSEEIPLKALWERSSGDFTTRQPTLLSGEVLATDSSSNRLALADATGTAILELQLPPAAWQSIAPGRFIELGFPPSSFVRRGFEIDCGSGPLIELDGRHPPLERRGTLFLRKGRHPFQVEWFNGRATSILQLGLDGPGFSHDTIPAAWLTQDDAGVPGLRYERFRVKDIGSLDEIPKNGSGDASGVAPQIDVTPAANQQDVALRFSGILEAVADGDYTFRLKSDDGARLQIGNTRPEWKVLPAGEPVSKTSWQEIEGGIIYAAAEGKHLRLEVATDQKRTEITVLNPAGLDPWTLPGRRIKAQGVVYDGGLCLLSAGQLHFESPGAPPAKQLTLASQVRELPPQRAAEQQPVVIQGVVTMSNHRSMVLQDESGGIFVLAENPAPVPQPEPGERWIVEGHTSPGDFSPIVVAERCRFQGVGALPPPRRPNREEILNGSLDAELVEIEGVVITLGDDRIELLTRDGTVVILSNEYYPLPSALLRSPERDLSGARLKLRGAFASSWNPQLGRLSPGVFLLGNASFSVIGLSPRDTGEIPLLTVPDLWKFTSKSTALNRVRLRGMMMAGNGDTLLVSDEPYCLRLTSPTSQGAIPGDVVEVTGFARTGPISPVIVQPEVRVLRHGSLPAAIVPDPAKFPDLSLDGKMIRLEGRVISDTIQSGERRLELETGALRFFAAGSSSSSDGETFLTDSRITVEGIYFATTSSPLSIGPGDFEVRMTGDHSLRLISRPPWWTTRRLLLLVVFLLGGLLLILGWVTGLQRLVNRRTSQLSEEIAKKEHAESERALEQERARVARDLHDELGAGLTEIGLLGSLVANPNIPATAKQDYIGTLGDVSRSLVSALDEIVWAINPDYDSVDDLASYLWLHAQRLLKTAGIDCDTAKPVVIPGGCLGSRSRQSLLLAFKEVLNNVIKHSQATRVVFGIRVEKEHVVVSIADNGIGISEADAPRPGSQGLAGLRERMHDLGGGCEIITTPGGGTIVNLTLLLKSP